jgi:hypothetical protein
MYNGMCFKLVKEKQTFSDAKSVCGKLGSHLIIIEDDLMNRYLEGMHWRSLDVMLII